MSPFAPSSTVHSRYRKELARAFRGEVAGQAFFGALARRADMEPQRAKLETLMRLEIAMTGRLCPVILRNAVALDRLEEATRQGSDEAPRIADWGEFIQWLSRELPAYIAAYRELALMSPPSDREALELLAAHEVALWEFGERETRGRTLDSLEPVEELLRRLEC